YAGVGFQPAVSLIKSNFVIVTWCQNGTSSYVRTNGVLVGGGNAGANAMGTLLMGNDQTGVSTYNGQVASFRIYAEAMSTNNLHIAEQNQATRYLGITLPSP